MLIKIKTGFHSSFKRHYDFMNRRKSKIINYINYLFLIIVNAHNHLKAIIGFESTISLTHLNSQQVFSLLGRHYLDALIYDLFFDKYLSNFSNPEQSKLLLQELEYKALLLYLFISRILH